MLEIWGLEKYLVEGELPKNSKEVLISKKLANKLNISVGDLTTFIGTTMHNAFTTYNFLVAGTFDLRKGQADKQMMLVDISGAREALDMEMSIRNFWFYTFTIL